MYDPTQFTLTDMTECGAILRKLGLGATSMEEAANRVVRYFYDEFVDAKTGEQAWALVRFFKTHAYAELSHTDLHRLVEQQLGDRPPALSLKCLTLLATAGSQPQWNTRQASYSHQVIPLVSEQLVAQSPMISQLIQQFGLTINTVLEPDPALLLDLNQTTFNVFYVPIALGSPYIPAQAEFVIPHQIQSVLGFGGILPSGNLFAVILFSKVRLPEAIADLFKTLALNVKMAVMPFEQQVFASNSISEH